MKKSQALMCPRCRRLVSKNQKICPWCGLTWPGKSFRFGKLMGYMARPETMIQSLIFLNAVFFVLSLILNFRGVNWSLDPFSALGPDPMVLFWLGSSGTVPVFQFGAWWTLVTAGFLHVGLIHLLFNMAALYSLGNLTVQVFGTFRMLLVYLVSNVAGFGLSLLGGVPVTVGASAAVCGLIGALFYYGWHRGGPYGQTVFRHTLGWVLALILFGVLGPNINNWGHAGGFAGGFAVAWVLGYTEIRSETMGMRLGAIAAACFCLVLLLGNLLFALGSIGPFAGFF